MSKDLISAERIEGMILQIRGQKVMLDRDLAALYGVETKALKRAVKRNVTRFPDDFMFVLTADELADWRCQFGTSNSERMGLRYPPMAFTEQGVAMLSSVLNSERAIAVNIAIMRTFVQVRRLMDGNRELARKIETLEKKYDEQFAVVFNAIKQLLSDDATVKSKSRIGFH